MQSYPSVTISEFSQACQALEICCQDKLDGSDWSFVNWAKDELTIRILRQNRDQIPTVDNDRIGELNEAEIEESDEEKMQRKCTTSSLLSIDFSILLSSSYEVPVLWFRITSEIPTSASQLETVYQLVVSAESREAVQNVGVMGGISIAHHPKSDLPAFFIHPCETPAVLAKVHSGKGISPVEYLLLWFGIVGSAVGLNVPCAVAAAMSHE